MGAGAIVLGSEFEGVGAGLVVASEINFHGVAIGALVSTRDLRGCSASTYTGVDGQRGLSIGVVNRAKHLRGMQIGLINYAGNRSKWLRWLPIVNWSGLR